MSVLGNGLDRRFWLGAAAAMVGACAFGALGAWLMTLGIWPLEQVGLWVSIAWLCGTFWGGRIAGHEGGALWRCLGAAAVAVCLMWALGLTWRGGTLTPRWLWDLAAALLGAVLAAALPQKAKRKGKRRR